MIKNVVTDEIHSSPWIKPLSLIIGFSFAIYFINRWIDSLLIQANLESIFYIFFNKDVGTLTNTLGGLAELVTSILGIEITVVAIIVQLAANKYSSKIMDLFVTDKTNISVIGLFIITGVNTILVTNTLRSDFVTLYSVGFNLLLIIFSLVIVLPHFNYVFNFLRPDNFLSYVKNRSIKVIDTVISGKEKDLIKAKDELTQNINFIGDIALNSVYQGDRAVTLLCINTLRKIVEEYLDKKSRLPEAWFKLSGKEYFDPDFSSYSSYVMNQIEEQKVLIERKIFGLLELVFNNSRLTLRDVASGVLLNSELIAIKSMQVKDKGALTCAFQYFNSYLRISIREKDSRSAFNTFEHYRIVGEKLLIENPIDVEKVAFYFRYYGQEANKNQVLFILETAAHDLCRLNEIAFDLKVPNYKTLLMQFLQLDEPIEESTEKGLDTKEISLVGVRIAQVKLAGYYLLKGETELARIIYQDMTVEPISRIEKIKDIIFNTTDEEFWEITPRGVNFYYVQPERREALREFFYWFEENKIENN
ncbi:MAG: DUF2254 domain-containing protein [Ignavibacteriaceae bacterium]|nr:DUF2254 domain-containing protein [Ignavibacteriaceae bacterium]